MSEGYIKLHRSILEWEWIDDLNTLCLWIHLLCTVNWRESSYRGMVVGAGQRLVSLTELEEEIPSMSKHQIRTAKEHLVRTGEIRTERTRWGDLITIENWAKYQVEKEADGTELARNMAQRWHRDGTTQEEEREEREEYLINAGVRARVKDGIWLPNRPPKTDEEKRMFYYMARDAFRAREEK